MKEQAPSTQPTVIEGALVPPAGARFTIVASRFNDFIVTRLIDGALDALTRHGVPAQDVTVIRVPGSWEIPIVCSQVATKSKVDAIIAVGCVIRGSTPHFDHVAAEVSKGIAQVSLSTGVPIAFGVLTTDTIEQAVDRAGAKAGNKGYEAAMAAIEMVTLSAELGRAGL